MTPVYVCDDCRFARMKAYQAQVKGFDLAIIAAESKAKASAEVIKTLLELEYARDWRSAIDQIEFCRRISKFDSWASQQRRSRTVSIEFLT